MMMSPYIIKFSTNAINFASFLLHIKLVKTACYKAVRCILSQSDQATQLHKSRPHQFTLSLSFIWQA